MLKYKCPKGHTDTYLLAEKELNDFKNKGIISKDIQAFLGCNECEDFYELLL